ncbi:hypothetical protein D9613_001813 [Agrocybe pediades]|uniref:Uncharacterized protein n=1 Tax=Agrocybe pediades TaxID=84607 RepID=A0A8H4VUP4_9AGAR|nr:hypothetical protein D9613_001813 [Agrocybe pediades]
MPVFDTVFPADSLEFCPTAGSQNIFVCGTYKLLDQPPVPGNSTDSSKVPQKRIGQCLAFEVHSSEEGDVQFEKIHSFDLPAIPDMKWCHRSSTIPLLAVANSEGFITLHEWREVKIGLRPAIDPGMWF